MKLVLKHGLTRAIVKYVNDNASARDKDAKLTGDDVREGLSCCCFCKST